MNKKPIAVLLLLLTLILPGSFVSAQTTVTCSTIGLNRTLRKGSSGADVMTLQKVLNTNTATQVAVSGAGSPGKETTTFGTATESAVKKFQTLNSLTADGIAGSATYTKMATACNTYYNSLNTTSSTTTTTKTSTTLAGYVWTRDLIVGSKGTDVLMLQKMLNTSTDTQVASTGPGSTGKETTSYGTATKNAVIKFQNKYTISPASGSVYSATRTKLNELSAAMVNNTPTNSNPVATNDTKSTTQNTATSGNVLSNDTDANGDTLTVTSFTVSGVSTNAGTTYTISNTGTIVINSNGTYSFTPTSTFTGTVPTVTYTVSDGKGGSATATLVITVSATQVDQTPTSTAGQFSFTLPSSAKTSAGVYNSSGVLLRTLWNGVTYTSGTHTEYWDGKDDAGNLIATDTSTYTVKVLSNNVTYTWEGVIGNTSKDKSGQHVFRQYYGAIGDMAITGSTAFYAAGYDEGATSLSRFSTSDPNAGKTMIDRHDYGSDMATTYVTTDGNYVYWGGLDSNDTAKNFVRATKVSDDSNVTFSSGTQMPLTYGRTVASAIDATSSNSNNVISGLAVQKNGNYLFVAHKLLNEIHVLNKTTGAAVRTISLTSPRAMAVDGSDNLWVISASNTVAKYTVNSDGTLSSATLTLSGLVEPLDVAVSPDDSIVAIPDGGSSQQVKAFSNSDGSASWTLGSAGGYATDPTVTNNKFYFNDTFSDLKNGLTFIAFQSDGSFWVGDQGNYRAQHYDSNRNYINNIMQLSATYAGAVDKNNPTRVMAKLLEFSVDYSKPLSPSNGSWTLVKNWKRGLADSIGATDNYIANDFTTFNHMMTLSNGRTYFTLDWESTTNPGLRYPRLFEAPASGNVRYTGIQFNAFENFTLQEDGSLLRIARSGNGGVGTGGYITKQALTGFSNNNPVWGTATNIATIPTITSTDPLLNPESNYIQQPVITSSGVVTIFKDGLSASNSGVYHLGGIKLGDNKYTYRTAKAIHDNYSGPYPQDGSYVNKANGTRIGGSEIEVQDKSIIWGFHGEFYSGGQTNQYAHVYDDGLLVSVFGTNRYESQGTHPDDYVAAPEMAGNALTMDLVKVGSDYYLYHPDEGDHAGLHRWKISNLNSISEQSTTVTGYGAEPVAGTDLMAGLPFNSALTSGTNGWTRYPTSNIKTNQYSGNDDVWEVSTSVKNYQKDNIDLYMSYGSIGAGKQNYYVARDLSVSPTANSWKLSGNIRFVGSQPLSAVYDVGANPPKGAYMYVLDDQGKVIIRLYREYTHPSPFWVTANGAHLGTVTNRFWQENYPQPFEMSGTSNGVVIKFAGESTTTLPVFESGANPMKPTTLKFNFSTQFLNYGTAFDVDSLRLTEN